MILVLAGMFLSASLLFLSSVYHPLTTQLAVPRYLGIFSSCGVLWFLATHRKTVPSSTSYKVILVTWEALAVFTIVSSLVNNTTLDDGLELVWLLLLVPVLIFQPARRLLGVSGPLKIAYALGISHGALLAASFISDPALKYRYLGIFGDPNQIGHATLMCLLPVLSMLPVTLAEGKKSRMVLLFSGVVVCFVLIVMSSQRSSLVAGLVCICIALSKTPRKVWSRALAVTALLVLLGFLAAQQEDVSLMIDRVIEKGSQAGAGLQGRERLWAKAMEDIQTFGHGKQYLVDLTNGFGAHNSFLHVLATRGTLATAMLGLLCLESLWLTWRFSQRKSVPVESRLAAVLIVVSYWLISMTEGMFGGLGSGPQISFLLTLGSVTLNGGERRTENYTWKQLPAGSVPTRMLRSTRA